VAAITDVGLAARLVLLGAVADGLDGVLARRYGGSKAGPYLDSLADVATFGVAPALLVASVVRETWSPGSSPVVFSAGLLLPGLFVAMAVLRLGMYTAYDIGVDETKGVQTTLAATILAAGVLAGYLTPPLLVGLAGLLAALMVTTIPYPDLHAQDALVMGLVQSLAILVSGYWGRVFAFALLVLALSYLFFGPRFYWGR
jgi:CDP-diacylglycerol--serine O-phosphatidyltransferase